MDYLSIIEPVQDYTATVQPVQPAHVNSVSTQQFEKRNCVPIRNPAQTSGPGDHTSSVHRPRLLPDVHVQWDDMLSPTRQEFSSDIVDNNLYMYGTDNANSHTPVTETNTKHYYSGFMGGRPLVGPSVYQGMDSSVPSYDVAIDRRPCCDAVAAGSAPVMSVASRPAGGLTCNVGVPYVTNCTTQSTANTPFTQGLRPLCLPCATTKLTRSPLKAERRPWSFKGGTQDVQTSPWTP